MAGEQIWVFSYNVGHPNPFFFVIIIPGMAVVPAVSISTSPRSAAIGRCTITEASLTGPVHHQHSPWEITGLA